jgi:hypothetical protein
MTDPCIITKIRLPLAIDRPLDFIAPLDRDRPFHRFPSTKFGDFYALGLQGFVSILTSVKLPIPISHATAIRVKPLASSVQILTAHSDRV